MVLLAVVTAGKVTPIPRHDAPQTIDRAVPLSLMRIINRCPSVGVPVMPDVIDVILVARAVIVSESQESVLNVGVADDATVVTLEVIRLFVSV